MKPPSSPNHRIAQHLQAALFHLHPHDFTVKLPLTNTTKTDHLRHREHHAGNTQTDPHFNRSENNYYFWSTAKYVKMAIIGRPLFFFGWNFYVLVGMKKED